MTDMTYRNYQAPPEQRPFSGMAITGFVFSLLWLGGLGSLAAVIVCGVAMKRAKTRGQNGRGSPSPGSSSVSWACLPPSGSWSSWSASARPWTARSSRCRTA